MIKILKELKGLLGGYWIHFKLVLLNKFLEGIFKLKTLINY
jgi:hypothetical protein